MLLLFLTLTLLLTFCNFIKADIKTDIKEILPNIIIFMVDDLGYGDLSAYGNPTISTPNIDKFIQGKDNMDKANVLKQVVAENSVCTPSRFSLLTGRHSIRGGMTDDYLRVLPSPSTSGGIPDDEILINELLKKEKGYKSAHFGKWHLGINKENSTDSHYIPTNRGFDYFYGLPFTNGFPCEGEQNNLLCFLYENNTIIEQPLKFDNLTQRMTYKALDFIQDVDKTPFYINMWYAEVHTPLFTAPEYKGISKRGSYGDAVYNVDWSIGEIINYIDSDSYLKENTIIIITSDNGPFLEEEIDGGSKGPLKGGKAQSWEGGYRVPFIFRYPLLGQIPTNNFMSHLDIFPTICDLVDITLPQDRIYDGYSLVNSWLFTLDNNQNIHIDMDKMDRTNRDRNININENEYIHGEFAYFCGSKLMSIRVDKYKITYMTQIWIDSNSQSCPKYGSIGACGCADGMVKSHDPPLIFDLEHDISEMYPLEMDRYLYLIVSKANKYRDYLINSIIPVENQIQLPSEDYLQPCCNPPFCSC